MIFYHGTNKDNWDAIQKEGTLYGRRYISDNNGNIIKEVSRCTYLATDLEEAKRYGDVILQVEYDPFKHKKENNYIDGSLICVGKGNPDWLNSAPHGAGRIMSRTQAKNTLNIDDFKESMKDIYTTSVCEETIDEAPMVYKDTKQIMEDVVPTVDIAKVIKPLYNFKAKTPEKAW